MIRRQGTAVIVVHCAATPETRDIGAAEIRRWHVEDNGWSDIGYHAVIRRSGLAEPGRPLWAQGAHVAGHNHNSIGVCLVGGIGPDRQPAANYTPEQWGALHSVVRTLLHLYPEAQVKGHRDLDPRKACPCFDAPRWWRAQSQAADFAAGWAKT